VSRLSVVIPTHDRETRLVFALESLAAQTAGPGALDVIVVRGPNAAEPLAAAPSGLDVRFLVSAELGPAPQRNVGWRTAAAPLVAFLDDDCRVPPDWATALLDAYEGTGGSEPAVIQGRTQPDPDELHLLYGLARTIEITGPTGLYETCNLAYPRALLELLDGFDEDFRLPHWGEDTDLGLRAEDAGARLVYADSVLAWHAVHPNPLPRAVREAGRRRRLAKLVARHPRLRRSLTGGVFVNGSHASVAIAAALGLAATAFPRRRRKLLAVAVAPYVARAYAHLAATDGITPRRAVRLALHLPSRAAVDVAETVATTRGACEERTLVI
jgi:GT2 family glycosyltransferase